MPEDPQDLSQTVLNYPNMPDSAPQEMVPGVPAPAQPSFQDQFEQKILQQLGMTREDFIKKKLDEDRKTKKQKFFTGLGDVIGTLGSSREKPFVTSLDKAKAEGGAEYDKLQPQLRQEAATIYAGKKQDSINASKEKIEADKAASAEKERQNKAELQRLKLAADQGVRGAKEALLKKQADLVTEETTNYTKKFDTPEMRNFMAAQSYKDKYGDKYGEALQNAAGLTDASKPASAMGMVRGNSPEEWKQSLGRIQGLESAKKLGKFAPTGGLGPNRVSAVDKFLILDPTTNNLVEKTVDRTPMGQRLDQVTRMPVDMAKLKPYDQKMLDTDRAAALGSNQALEGANNILQIAAMPDGAKRVGPVYGNALAQGVRSITDLGQAFEEINRNTSVSNVALLHTKSLVGARPPQNIVSDMKNLSGKPWQEVASQLRSIASMYYSIQNIKLTNQNDPLSAKLNDPRVVAKMDEAVNQFLSQAKTSRELAKSGGVPATDLKLQPLKPLTEILKELDVAKTPQDKAKAALDNKF